MVVEGYCGGYCSSYHQKIKRGSNRGRVRALSSMECYGMMSALGVVDRTGCIFNFPFAPAVGRVELSRINGSDTCEATT